MPSRHIQQLHLPRRVARVDEFQRIDDLGQLIDLHVLPQRQAEHALGEVFGQRQRATTRVSN